MTNNARPITPSVYRPMGMFRLGFRVYMAGVRDVAESGASDGASGASDAAVSGDRTGDGGGAVAGSSASTM